MTNLVSLPGFEKLMYKRTKISLNFLNSDLPISGTYPCFKCLQKVTSSSLVFHLYKSQGKTSLEIIFNYLKIISGLSDLSHLNKSACFISKGYFV